MKGLLASKFLAAVLLAITVVIPLHAYADTGVRQSGVGAPPVTPKSSDLYCPNTVDCADEGKLTEVLVSRNTVHAAAALSDSKTGALAASHPTDFITELYLVMTNGRPVGIKGYCRINTNEPAIIWMNCMLERNETVVWSPGWRMNSLWPSFVMQSPQMALNGSGTTWMIALVGDLRFADGAYLTSPNYPGWGSRSFYTEH